MCGDPIEIEREIRVFPRCEKEAGGGGERERERERERESRMACACDVCMYEKKKMGIWHMRGNR